MQQNITSGSKIFRGRFLFLVMADPVFAGNEDHARRGDAGNITGVMPGAGNDIHMAIPRNLRALADRIHAVRIELNGRGLPDFFKLHLIAAVLGGFLGEGAEFSIHLTENLVLRMAEIDGEEHLARDGIA